MRELDVDGLVDELPVCGGIGGCQLIAAALCFEGEVAVFVAVVCATTLPSRRSEIFAPGTAAWSASTTRPLTSTGDIIMTPAVMAAAAPTPMRTAAPPPPPPPPPEEEPPPGLGVGVELVLYCAVMETALSPIVKEVGDAELSSSVTSPLFTTQPVKVLPSEERSLATMVTTSPRAALLTGCSGSSM